MTKISQSNYQDGYSVSNKDEAALRKSHTGTAVCVSIPCLEITLENFEKLEN